MNSIWQFINSRSTPQFNNWKLIALLPILLFSQTGCFAVFSRANFEVPEVESLQAAARPTVVTLDFKYDVEDWIRDSILSDHANKKDGAREGIEAAIEETGLVEVTTDPTKAEIHLEFVAREEASPTETTAIQYASSYSPAKVFVNPGAAVTDQLRQVDGGWYVTTVVNARINGELVTSTEWQGVIGISRNKLGKKNENVYRFLMSNKRLLKDVLRWQAIAALADLQEKGIIR